MFAKSVLVAATIAGGSVAAVIRENMAETVLLANCMNGNNVYQHSEYAYFSGAPNGNPSAVAIAQNLASWELPDGSTNSGQFPDQNTFTSLIRFQPDDGTYAGLGRARQGDFDCWRHDHNYAYDYVNPSGLICVEQYICNHVSPATVPVFTHFSPSGDAVTLETTSSQTASQIIGLAKNVYSGGQCRPGNSQTISDNGCTISFSCGANSDAELDAMVAFLLDSVAETPQFSAYRHVNNGPSPPCQSEVACPPPPPQDLYYVTMPTELVMSINYLETPQYPEGQAAASLSYQIACPARSCFACQFLKTVLGGASLVPDLGTFAGAANLGVSTACQQAAGC